MPLPLTPFEEELIAQAQIPLEFQQLKEKHPVAVLRLAEGWGTDPLPTGYEPKAVAIYYDGSEDEDWLFVNGTPKRINWQNSPTEPSSIVLEIDALPRYVEIEGKVVLNTLGGVILPDAVFDVSVQAELLLAMLQQQ